MSIVHRGFCLVAALLVLTGLGSRGIEIEPARGQLVQLSEKTLDQLSFGTLTVIGAELKCRESLQAQMELLDRAIVISDAQRSKLQVAGELDIARFFASYDELKRSFEFGNITRNEFQARIAKLQTEAQPIKEKYEAGIHGKSSLFAKILTRTLDADQHARIRSFNQQRANRAYANYIRYTLAFVDPQLPMTRLQRDTITELMLHNTSPPESYGTSLAPAYRVLSRMGKIEDQIRPLFSEQEWAVISALIARGKAMAKE